MKGASMLATLDPIGFARRVKSMRTNRLASDESDAWECHGIHAKIEGDRGALFPSYIERPTSAFVCPTYANLTRHTHTDQHNTNANANDMQPTFITSVLALLLPLAMGAAVPAPDANAIWSQDGLTRRDDCPIQCVEWGYGYRFCTC